LTINGSSFVNLLLYSQSKESPREAKPLFFKLIPLSFEGEGDTGGEVANYPTPFSFPVSAVKRP